MNNDNKDNELKRLEMLLARNMAQITAKILVLSNKGGVGKSSVAVNIAVCLSKKGAKVGLLDADMHGPSVAKMLGFEGKRLPAGENSISPYPVNPNLVAVSMASFLESVDTPVVWRGPLKMTALRQFLAEVNWGKLDYLVIDSPPGTGDEPLSVCQLVRDLTGAIIVTTPQDIALLDSRKCVSFLRQLSVPILGILENMSGLTCPHCGENIDIFKSGGGEKAAKELNIPFLGRIPFDMRIVETTDDGKSYIETYFDSEAAKVIEKICSSIDGKVRSKH
ncbi:MAG: ATP-binding protein [Elusimicrobia bacterium CG1_02_37_114]|nr:MAG: ATP-binding protein [Elusimicrobia bacterium CG1_02_37_114]PIV53915.1 MAG: ATP-binding protein [Elusimicrobia bacterium CG02_land_8_20_14_3_00_37_13]PIZ13078.1 MAG: ATP-binding protein [Elusimicrobia bacterium CG_4_10_14_0_8_um_filter_37_32]